MAHTPLTRAPLARTLPLRAYPVVLGTMFGVCGILYRGFKRNGRL
jgi:hypothetical protein